MGLFMAGFIALKLIGTAFVVLLIVRLVVAARGSSNGALESASRRFAAGEITEDQFRRIRDVLDS
jgi:uncharacterized membrane protein